MDKVIIQNEEGDAIEVSTEALHLQCTLLEVVKDNDQANRRALLAVLKRIDNLLNALYELSKDKDSDAKKQRYQEAKRGCETDILYYGKSIHNSSETAVQGELFTTAAP